MQGANPCLHIIKKLYCRKVLYMYVVKYSNGLYIKDRLGFTENLNEAAIYRSETSANNSASSISDYPMTFKEVAGCTYEVIKVKLVEAD